MAFDRFLIAPMESGLENNLKPWIIPEGAFEQLDNAYAFRGRIRKRFGSVYMGNITDPGLEQTASRLRIALTDINSGASIMTDGSGNASGTVPGDYFAIGQMFQIGTTLYTVTEIGIPGILLQADFPASGPDHVTTTATYNTTTGAFNFVGAIPAMSVYFYPSLPVMGLANYQTDSIDNQPSYGFDTRFAYVFVGGHWERSVNSAADPITGLYNDPTWNGTDSNFFWTTNWNGLFNTTSYLFVTNFYVVNRNDVVDATDDPIWYFDGSSWDILPAVLTTDTDDDTTIATSLKTSLIILPFHNRLVALNTIETTYDESGNPVSNAWYPQRARWSHQGSPLGDNSWLEFEQEYNSLFGDGAGFDDASTKEQIIGAEFIKDRLIIYFETSTWELVFTNNQASPFAWQKINTELGSQSTFSTVPFDQEVLAIGNTGVHACSGSNVSRIDVKIPDEVFKIRQRGEGVERVCGIRDYFTEMVYWSMPSSNQPGGYVYPNRILVYNYRNGTWAFNDDSITTFGYFEQQDGITWAQLTSSWANANMTWSSGVLQSNFRQIIAGNQEGYVFIIAPDLSSNAGVLQINSMDLTFTALPALNITNNNLLPGDYIQIENAKGITFAGSNIFQVLGANQSTGDIVLSAPPGDQMTGVYAGGGTVARVSQIKIKSKQWNPYVKDGRNVFLSRIDFCFTRTAAGEVFVDYFPASSNTSMVAGGKATGSLWGTSIVETSAYTDSLIEQNQQRVWHPLYFQVDGNFIQILITLTDDQMRDPGISLEDFSMEALILNTKPTSVIFQ